MKILVFVLLIIPINLTCQSKTNSQNKELISAQIALEKFYNFQGEETANMDPLILAGEKVVPLLLEEIKNRNMPKRRYAIGFLGNGEYIQSIPVLEKILNSSDETDIYRGDALLSIYQINKELGMKYAKEHKDDQNFVGEIAQDIIRNASYIHERRTYADALKNYSRIFNAESK